MPSLKKALDDIASRFATEILAALSRASVDELQQAIPNGSQVPPRTAKTRGKGGASTSGHALEQLTASVVAHLKEHGPLHAEDLRKALGISRNDTVKALALALSWKVVTKSGQKRETSYKAVNARGPKPQLTVGDRLRVAAVMK